MSGGESPGLAALRATRRGVAEEKARATLSAIEVLVNRNANISFPAVAREAQVSTSFLYAHPELRAAIDERRTGRSGRSTKQAIQTDEPTALTELLVVRAECAALRDEVQTLRTRLGETLGGGRPSTPPQAAEVDGLRSENDRLRAQIRELERSNEDLEESLNSSRVLYRRVMAELNR